MFGKLGIFSEFERGMIVARVNSGLPRAKKKIARDGHFRSKAGKIRKRLGRPNADPKKIDAARRETVIPSVDQSRGERGSEIAGGCLQSSARCGQ